MIHSEGTFSGYKGLRIYHQSWVPDTEPHALILLVHGLGEHSSRYGNVVDRLVPKGYAIYALDHIGHGRSEGARKYADSFSVFTDTLTEYLTKIKVWHPDLPVYLLGHSLGGLIGATYLLEHQAEFSGAILSAPALMVYDKVTPLMWMAGKVLSVVWPKAGLLALKGEAASRSPEVLEANSIDPLVVKTKTTARLSVEIYNAMLHVQAKSAMITLPMLILQGTADVIVNPEGAETFFENISSRQKTLKMYDGLFHEVFNEPERELVLDDLEAWLETVGS
jgi:alpha-beta hydrolase superfamily lysophospholipase